MKKKKMADGGKGWEKAFKAGLRPPKKKKSVTRCVTRKGRSKA
jgi:hypothetical protein